MAKRNSTHAKLYRFTFTDELPENLCPYFWQVLFGFFFLIPNAFLQLPFYLIATFDKKLRDKDCFERRVIGGMIYVALLLLAGYFNITLEWVKAMFGCYSYDSEDANLGWVINLLIFLIFGFGYLAERAKKRPEKLKEDKEKKPSLIKEFLIVSLNFH